MSNALSIIITFTSSLGLTLLIELLIGAVFNLEKKDFILLALVNIITNPAVVYIDLLCRAVIPTELALWQLPLEAAAVIAEWLLYKKFSASINRPFEFSAIANTCSYGFGLVLNLIM